MTKRQKLLQRFRTNPKTVRFGEIDNLLIGLGFEKRQVGSHATYRLNENIITIPVRKPYVLPVYVKNLIALLDAIAAASDEA